MHRPTVVLIASTLLLVRPVWAEPSSGEPPLRLLWKRAPITIGLPVGKERMVTFPSAVRLGVPAAIAGRMRVQVVDRTVYLYASAPFEQTRLVAENPLNGAVYLLDVNAQKFAAQAAAVEIFEEGKAAAAQGSAAKASATPPADDEPDLVALTRHAAQQVYAPARLLRPLAGVRPVSVDTAVRPGFYRLANIQAQPLGSWKSASRYVTAVKLTNRAATPIELDPRALRGRWLAATFQHGRLLAAGHEEDTSVVYVVSEQRFDESF